MIYVASGKYFGTLPGLCTQTLSFRLRLWVCMEGWQSGRGWSGRGAVNCRQAVETNNHVLLRVKIALCFYKLGLKISQDLLVDASGSAPTSPSSPLILVTPSAFCPRWSFLPAGLVVMTDDSHRDHWCGVAGSSCRVEKWGLTSFQGQLRMPLLSSEAPTSPCST